MYIFCIRLTHAFTIKPSFHACNSQSHYRVGMVILQIIIYLLTLINIIMIPYHEVNYNYSHACIIDSMVQAVTCTTKMAARS